MKTLKLLFTNQFPKLLMLLAVGCFVASCGGDDPVTGGGGSGGGGSEILEPISSFQFQVSDTDWRVVSFSNFSQNATDYEWNFGDGNMSTEENPTHTYAAGGTYEVDLIASSGNTSKTSTKTIEITDPNAAAQDLTGGSTKVWKLSRNISDELFPMQVGPENRSEIWWALGRDEDIAVRPCTMDEEYHFSADGTFSRVTDGTVWADAGVWAGDAGCIDDQDAGLMVGPNGENLLPWGPGDFTFDFDPNEGTLTVNGLGAYIGLAKAATAEEITEPQNSVTYKVVSLVTDGPVDFMTLETTIPVPGYWQFNLVSYDNPADEPLLGDPLPVAGFSSEVDGSTVRFTNTSARADSYFWDFGDGNTSTEESPTHTYSSDGTYTVILTATSSAGEATTEQTVIISANSVFSMDVLHGGSSKTWTLSPTAGALAVGPFEGSGEWFQTSIEDVDTRACTFDDTYTFDTDGNFIYNTNGDVWAESYMGVAADGCLAEADLPAEAAPWGSGEHKYTLTDMGDAFLTVTGTGAFIALPKAFNGGEYAAPEPAVDGSVRYRVNSYVNDGTSETLVITVDISENSSGGAFWSFTLRAQ